MKKKKFTKRQLIAQSGGKATFKEHGSKHFSKLAKLRWKAVREAEVK